MGGAFGGQVISVSVVIPVYNSAATLNELVDRLHKILVECTERHEIILVNDGSHDNSWNVIREIVRSYADARGIDLTRNFGQHNALLCGIRAASYSITITMDDDLQHPPEEIPKLLRVLVAGSDVVYGIPHEMPHSLWRNFASKLTKLSLAIAMRQKRMQELSAFRAFKTDLRNAFEHYKSPQVLLDVLLSWGTARFESIPVNHCPRLVGKSNYGLLRLLNQAMLAVTGFSAIPLRVASAIGFGFTLFGIIVLFYVVVSYFRHGSVPGFTFLASLISLFAGVQLFALGIVGEFIAQIFGRSLDRPTFIIRETSNLTNLAHDDESLVQ